MGTANSALQMTALGQHKRVADAGTTEVGAAIASSSRSGNNIWEVSPSGTADGNYTCGFSFILPHAALSSGVDLLNTFFNQVGQLILYPL